MAPDQNKELYIPATITKCRATLRSAVSLPVYLHCRLTQPTPSLAIVRCFVLIPVSWPLQMTITYLTMLAEQCTCTSCHKKLHGTHTYTMYTQATGVARWVGSQFSVSNHNTIYYTSKHVSMSKSFYGYQNNINIILTTRYVVFIIVLWQTFPVVRFKYKYENKTTWEVFTQILHNIRQNPSTKSQNIPKQLNLFIVTRLLKTKIESNDI